MKTRGSGEKKKEFDKLYSQKARAKEGKKEEERKKARERRRKRREKERVLSDRYLVSQEKVQKLKMTLAKVCEQEAERLEDPQIVEDIPEQNVDLLGEESEDEEYSEKNSLDEFVQVCEELLSKPNACKELTSLDIAEFESFVRECSAALDETTYRGTQRVIAKTSTSIPHRSFIFFTLFWLRHYLPLKVLSHFFKIPDRTCTRILKRTTVALAKLLANDIQFPADDAMEDLQDTQFQNLGFSRCVCVVDGTEIQISRPKNPEFQSKTYSGKKKQNSLNVMIITKLNGEIIYHSPLRVGAHDQAHWNELNLREKFVGKEYGIMGDGGFTFNQSADEQQIRI